MTRHCAVCLKSISNNEIKSCGACKRRAYCSKECQIVDWSGEKGHSHKLFCKDYICEEDIDWEVKESIGKGLGLFAKKDIPKHSKILVERGYNSIQTIPLDLLNSLTPITENSSLQQKFDNNCFNSSSGRNLGIRISRVNHNCSSNSNSKFIPDLNIFILYSINDIKQGEEITTQYINFQDYVKPKLIRDGRNFNLLNKWGITCSNDCICKNKLILDKIQQAYELDSQFDPSKLSFTKESDVFKILKMVDKIIQLGKDVGLSITGLESAYYFGFKFQLLAENHYHYIKCI